MPVLTYLSIERHEVSSGQEQDRSVESAATARGVKHLTRKTFAI